MKTLRVALSLISSIAILLSLVGSTGCTTLGKEWKKVIGDDSGEKAKASGASARPLSYNQQSNVMPNTYRKYKRTTRGDLENQAHLESKAGSLWVMEGQGAYLFSQNIVRMIGDPIAIKLEGDPVEQLSAKSKVIAKLLAQLEERRRRAMGRAPAGGEEGAKPDDKAAAANGAPAPGAPGAPAEKAANGKNGQPGANSQNANAANGGAAAPGVEETKDFAVKTVPTRVVERMVDGNYRIRGMQPFMIGQREYKVIVSGVVKAEDFNEEGINSSQLIDSSFDIVSSKSAESRQ